MSISLRAFNVGLYEEHLEETSFLYDHCRALRLDSVFPWMQVEQFENRLEAHIDALMAGGVLALEVCVRRAKEGDAGELFGAVSVYCRHQDGRLLAETWRTLEFEDEKKVMAVTDALKYELPQSWDMACRQAIERGDGRLLPLLATVCAFRRAPYAKSVAERISTDMPLAKHIAWAISRLPFANASEPAVKALLEHSDPAIASNAHLALLRAGKRDALRACLPRLKAEDRLQLSFALGGDRSCVAPLQQRLDNGTATKDTLVALGLLGDITTVRSLVAMLGNEELGPIAAEALYWITGAPLFENAFVPEKMDETTLFDKEIRELHEQQKPPGRRDGEPFGELVRRLVCDPAIWSEWLTVNATRFNPEYRYRRGDFYSARALFDCLLDGSAPNRLRQLAYEELTIRFGCDVPFESDFRVKDQRVALQTIAKWVADNEARLDTGHW